VAGVSLDIRSALTRPSDSVCQKDIGGLEGIINLDQQLGTTCGNRVAVIAYDQAARADMGEGKFRASNNQSKYNFC